MVTRLANLLESIKETEIDALFLSTGPNIRYISGFTGSTAAVLVHPAKNCIITDFRYIEQAEAQCPQFEVVRWSKETGPIEQILNGLVEHLGIKKLGFEQHGVNYEAYAKLAEALPKVELVGAKGLVEKLRYVKDEQEAQAIAQAAKFSDRAFTAILDFIKPGVTEKEVALELEYIMRKLGAEDRGFQFIVVSGERTSLPHGQPTEAPLQVGDFVTMDFGAQFDGYKSDMTRTIAVGSVDEKQREIYSLVQKAQQQALDAMGPGVVGSVPDQAARALFKQHGLDDKFGHGLGHGVGLEIHEEPFMNSQCTKTLLPGCIVTVEPGVYLPGWGGIRIEDTVLVTADGTQILTKSSKDLIIV